MRFVAVVASSLALVASVTAQVPGFAAMSAPTDGEVVPAGSTYTIKWEAGQYTGNVKITLLGGKTPGTLQVDGEIASGIAITDESYPWNVDCKLGDKATYGIQITSEDDPATFQYSFPFHIDNSKCDASGGESSSTYAPSVSSSMMSVTKTGYPTSAPPVSSSTMSVTMTGYPTSSPPKPTQSMTEDESEMPSSTSYKAVPTEQSTTQSTTQAPTASTTLMTSASVTSASTTTSATTSPIPIAAAGRNAVSLAAIGGIVVAAFAL